MNNQILVPHTPRHATKDDLWNFFKEEAKAAMELKHEYIEIHGCFSMYDADYEELDEYFQFMIDVAHSINNMEKDEFMRRPIIAYRGAWKKSLRSA